MRLVPALIGGLAAAAVLIAARGPAPRAGPPVASVAEGRAVFARMGCGSCHRLAAAGSEGPVGPDLDARLPSHSRASLRAVIRDPPTLGTMPQDFAERMTAAELSALVDFLLSARR